MTTHAAPVGRFALENHGLGNLHAEHWNQNATVLLEEAVRRGQGVLTEGGAFAVETGQHTGRSPKDKFIVESDSTRDTVDWGAVNKPVTPAVFRSMHERVCAYMQGREAFVQDLWCGADETYRLPVRLVTDSPWHAAFARNMFIRPPAAALDGFRPGFTILHAPTLAARGAADGLNSETFILLDFDRRMALIGGTLYAGEVKKSVFSILNHLLPEQDVLPMHCSANIGPKGDTAIFFGLSGTGKTTLSADGTRTLIGDDEHGWSDAGVFNFEGGCYAKVIKLSPTAEPEIWATTRRFGTVLENVVFDPATRVLDLDDGRLTENTRACYPLDSTPSPSDTGVGGPPENVVMLTADAFGVLPPIARLSPDQAMYHFLSGYTAKVAGTERGLKEPAATFSTCFGAPFMPRHPTVYAKLLGEKMATHNAKCWLVNTGWSGGGYGEGQRMKIAHTRAMLNAALKGDFDGVELKADPNFGVLVPQACPNVPIEVLNPRNTWADGGAYDAQARDLTQRFENNFQQFEGHVDDQVKAAAIRAAA